MQPSHLKYYLCIDVTKSFILSDFSRLFSIAIQCNESATQFGQYPKFIEQGIRSLYAAREPGNERFHCAFGC